jgi:hypothetical protein
MKPFNISDSLGQRFLGDQKLMARNINKSLLRLESKMAFFWVASKQDENFAFCQTFGVEKSYSAIKMFGFLFSGLPRQALGHFFFCFARQCRNLKRGFLIFFARFVVTSI